MVDTQNPLAVLRSGDIFYAATRHGVTLICLVLSVTDTQIISKRVTSQEPYLFDRLTGMECAADTVELAKIVSIAPLPEPIHSAILTLNQKYEGYMSDEDFRLTQAEREALLFLAPFYDANPLPAI